MKIELFFQRIGLLAISLFCLLSLSGQDIYNNAGEYLYSIPDTVSQIKVECWGAGGGGASATYRDNGGGGGGGGAYAGSILTVTPGNTYIFVVGAGGAADSDGEDSYFDTDKVVAAGGKSADNNDFGNGGKVNASTGDTKYAGGNGATGQDNSYSGAGGGGAGSNETGGDATTAAAGTGGDEYGGDGGDRRVNNNEGVGYDGESAGGGGGGAYFRRGNSGGGRQTEYAGGTGADGQVIITLPSYVYLSSPNQIEEDSVYQGTTDHPISSFKATISTSNTTLETLTFTTSGTYTATDISNFQLWFSTTNDFTTATQIGSSITTDLGTGEHSFTNISQGLSSDITYYFWITIDVEDATEGAYIIADAITSDAVSCDFATIAGNIAIAGKQVFKLAPKIVLSSDNPAVAAADLEQGTSDNIIYSYSTTISNINTTLDSVLFTTTGSYDDDDFSRFKLYYSTTNDFTTATQVGSSLITNLGTGTHTFTSISLECIAGTTIYFWITVNVSDSPDDGHTITVSAINTDDLYFSLGVKSGTAYDGGQQIINLKDGLLITTSYPAVSATSLLQGSTEERFYKFKAIATGDDISFNSVTFITNGSYVAGDVDNFQLWYNDVNSLVSATQIDEITTGLGTGSHIFNNINQTLSADNTYYFWITVDIDESATIGNTLYVEALLGDNIDATTTEWVRVGRNWVEQETDATITVSTYNGGIQTIEENVDTDGDGISDLDDYDDDNDGIPDYDENTHCNRETEELFPNSDFESGNTGFTSGYEYKADINGNTQELWDEGTYSVVSNPHDVHTNFSQCTGHGNIMVINGSPNADMIIWSSGVIEVTPYTDYTLSVELTSVTESNPAQLIFNVNGENIGSQFNANSTTCDWVEAQTVWSSGSNTQATFEIVNLNLIAGGNDFALDNLSCTYRENCDTDGDTIPDKMDLDSDNDGIYDIVEAGGNNYNKGDGTINNTTDNDNDGLADVVDNVNSGSGGSEVTSGTPLDNDDFDGDGTPNSADLDSDGDLCADVIEAGFDDADLDSLLGTSTVEVDANGVVTGQGGYTEPDDNDNNSEFDFLQQVPVITQQPEDLSICIMTPANAVFEVVATNTGGTNQWQVSEDEGATWNDISGETNTTLTMYLEDATYDSNMYRLLLYNDAYACSPLISDEVQLLIFTNIPDQPGEISGNDTVCQNIDGLTYSIAGVDETEYYTWSVPSDWDITDGEDSISMTTSSGSTSGNVQVSATNICGTSPVRSLAVIVEEPTPSFILPTTTTVCQGAEVTYKTESGKSDYDWDVEESNGDYSVVSGGDSDDNYLVLKWTASGSKTVKVNYSYGGCKGTAASKTITVNPNAVVLTQPQTPDTMCAGSGSATLSVTTYGTVSGYQWQVSTDGGTTWTNLSNTSPYSNVTTTDMTITNPSASLDSALYRCLITGSCGNITSNTVVLTVNATEIDSQSTNGQTICKGDTLSKIYVTAIGNNLTYQWYSNSTASTIGGTSLGSNYGAQTDTLTPPSDATGTIYYYCIVSGDCGTDTSDISGAFTINALPVINLSVSSDTIVFGSFADLSANGGTTYTWTSNPNSVLSDLNSTTIYNPRYTPSTNPTNIPPIVTTTFKVNVTDANNCSIADSVHITLYRKPGTGPQHHLSNTWGK